MNKKKLLELINKKTLRKQALATQAAACEDVAQLRTINAELDTLNEEIRSLQEVADSIPDTDPGDPDGRTATIAGYEEARRGAPAGEPIPGFVVTGAAPPATRTADVEGIAYRNAFMEHVLRGTPIPAELRANQNTLTGDVTSVLPPVVANRIVETMESIGMILPLITRTSYASGVNIPTSSVKPTATWVAEGAGSDRQKKTTGVISFTHHKLRCEISVSMEVSVMALSAFEAVFTRQVSEAMVKAIESKILSNDLGAANPRGILAEAPNAGQTFSLAAIAYADLIAAEAALPQAYENGARWAMSKSTFYNTFVGMVDNNEQPIARVTQGIDGKPVAMLLGRPVVMTGDYLPSFNDALESGAVFAFLFNFGDYVLNTIYDMGIQRKQDWETEDMLTKAVMSADGRVVDKNSLVTLKKL